MKFNIKPSDAKYIIDEKNRVVVCRIENTRHLFQNFVNKNFKIGPNCDEMLWVSTVRPTLSDKLIMPNRFVGVAKCSQDDEWSEETGKLIAFSRAKDKLNKSFFKRANTYINCLDKWTNEAAATLRNIGNKLTINTQHRHNLIKSIIGDDE